jgi:hypothetical protein
MRIAAEARQGRVPYNAGFAFQEAAQAAVAWLIT